MINRESASRTMARLWEWIGLENARGGVTGTFYDFATLE
jgi:hypothetical protein